MQRVGVSHEFSKRCGKREMSMLGRCIRFSTWASAWWRLCRSTMQSGRCRSYAESKSAVLNGALARLIWFSDGGTRSFIPILATRPPRPYDSDDSREDRSGAALLKSEDVGFSLAIRRYRFNYIHRYLNLRGRFELGLFVSSYHPFQARAVRRKIDQLGYARF